MTIVKRLVRLAVKAQKNGDFAGARVMLDRAIKRVDELNRTLAEQIQQSQAATREIRRLSRLS